MKKLLRRVADMDPLTYSTDGIDDRCFFCGADTETVAYKVTVTDSTEITGYRHSATHEPECTWVLARQHLGMGLDGHKVLTETPKWIGDT